MQRLNRLLQSHQFLKQTLDECGATLDRREAQKLKRELDEAFSRLVLYASPDPRITLAQLELMMAGLAKLAPNSSDAKALRDGCLEALKRFAAEACRYAETQKRSFFQSSIVLPPDSFQLLDSQSDRISIFDRDYRYTFTNTANAAFHGKRPSDFVGMPSEVLVGRKCFAQLTKPSLDECFCGKTLKFPISLTHGTKQLVYAASVEPVRDENQDVVAAMVITRDITDYGIATDRIWPSIED